MLLTALSYVSLLYHTDSKNTSSSTSTFYVKGSYLSVAMIVFAVAYVPARGAYLNLI